VLMIIIDYVLFLTESK